MIRDPVNSPALLLANICVNWGRSLCKVISVPGEATIWKSRSVLLFLGLKSLLLCFLTGCQIPRSLTRDDVVSPDEEIHVRSVWLIDSTEIDFRSDSLGYAVISDSAIVRTVEGGRLIEIPIDSVQFAGSTRYPTAREQSIRTLLIIGMALVVLLAITPFGFGGSH